MSDPNPNYVPVDWASSPHPDDPRSELGNDGLTDEEREAGLTPMFGPPVVIDTEHERLATERQLNATVPEDSDPARETSTLNSAGEPIKIGDRVHHLADAGFEDRDTGTVTYVGPVTITGVTVENGTRVQWDGYEDETPHHPDLLTVLL